MGGETKVSPGRARWVQVRKERKDGFGAAKRRSVLDHLAACCNITWAAVGGWPVRRRAKSSPRLVTMS